MNRTTLGGIVLASAMSVSNVFATSAEDDLAYVDLGDLRAEVCMSNHSLVHITIEEFGMRLEGAIDQEKQDRLNQLLEKTNHHFQTIVNKHFPGSKPGRTNYDIMSAMGLQTFIRGVIPELVEEIKRETVELGINVKKGHTTLANPLFQSSGEISQDCIPPLTAFVAE